MSLCSFGISAATEHPEVCWEFLKQTLEGETAASFVYFAGGFPMSRALYDDAIREATQPVRQEDGSLCQEMSEESAGDLTALIESIDRIRFRYEGIRRIIAEEVQAWMADGTPVERTAALIQNRVTTFLDERR